VPASQGQHDTAGGYRHTGTKVARAIGDAQTGNLVDEGAHNTRSSRPLAAQFDGDTRCKECGKGCAARLNPDGSVRSRKIDIKSSVRMRDHARPRALASSGP
jgi:hypothetical protein